MPAPTPAHGRAPAASSRRAPWYERHALLIDSIGTFFLLVLFLLTGPTSTDAALSLALIVPLAVRRRFPVVSVVLVYLAGLPIANGAVGIEFPMASIAVPLALYSVTLHGPRWAYRTAIITGLLGCTLYAATLAVQAGLSNSSVLDMTGVLFMMATTLVSAWAFGLMRRSRRETITALIDRAAQLEVERDQQAQIATAAERTRIAREMHDIVAHSLSVIIAQADGGRYVATKDPAAAERVLGTIADTGRDALADMRRLLGVLRGGEGGRAPGGPVRALPAASAERVPQPASGDLDTLVDQVRASGVDVSFVRMGSGRTLPPGVGLSVYRICQESLTNVLKHAGPSPKVTILLQWRDTSLVLDVSDDGRGAASSATSDGAGQGLLGMQERAAMFGGTLVAGPRAGGGFRVHLELPIPPDAPRSGPAPLAPAVRPVELGGAGPDDAGTPGFGAAPPAPPATRATPATPATLSTPRRASADDDGTTPGSPS